jgi:transposase
MANRIERVDELPIIMAMLKKLCVQEIIDKHFFSHGNWSGLSYGQLAVLFITYVLHSLTHRLYGMEQWLNQHKAVIQQITGWQIGDKDATDDRLGIMTEVLGENDEKSYEFQQDLNQHTIVAHELPTDTARYDTTSFNVSHEVNDDKNGILHFGHTKNYRPDLLQFKQGLAVLDPAGIPILSETLPGNMADDPCYFPAWQRIVKTLGRTDFLYIADSKASATKVRMGIDIGNGLYLFPLPKTGDTPKVLRELVLNPPHKPQPVEIKPIAGHDDGKPRIVGSGFIVDKQMEAMSDDGTVYQWNERWIVCQSDAHAYRQKKSFYENLDKAMAQLDAIKPKSKDTASTIRTKADNILKTYRVQEVISLNINETIELVKKYKGKGRPCLNTPYEMVENRHVDLQHCLNEDAVAEYNKLAGWRIYVTNTTSEQMTLNQSAQYYRDEYLVERGFHRFKKGHIPALPLFIRIPERIKGLMLLLTIALQILTLIEYVSRNELAKTNDSIAGLVPGNPKMKTKQPTAERLLSAFENINLLIKDNRKTVKGVVVESLSSLQKKILSILKLSENIFNLSFNEKINSA